MEVAETTNNFLQGTLMPEEAAFIANAVTKRQLEFAAVRFCARICLKNLGQPPAAIVPGLAGAPRWPSNVVGSMTHCNGYSAAAVGLASRILTVGIDAEPHEPLPEGVLDLVASPSEIGMLNGLSRTNPEIFWDKILFSAKESFYKAWFPLTSKWLDFLQVEVSISAQDETFSALALTVEPLPSEACLTKLGGRWLIGGNLVMTSIVILSDTVSDR